MIGHDQEAAGDGAEEDGEEGAGLDQGVAGEKFVGLQMDRQDAVFQRPEEGRMHPHEEQHDHQEGDAAGREGAARRSAMMTISATLMTADEPLLLEFVGELPGRGGEEEEGQDEDAGRHRHHELAVDTGRPRPG